MLASRVGAAVVVACGVVVSAATAAAPTELVVAPASGSVVAVRLNPPARSFTVAAVGDFLSEPSVNGAAAGYAPQGVRFDYEPLLRPIESIVQSADLAICHMETPIGAPGAVVGFAGKSSYGSNLIAAAAELPGDLARVGFDRCSTASNHSNDLGIDGIRTTLEAFDAVGISHTDKQPR